MWELFAQNYEGLLNSFGDLRDFLWYVPKKETKEEMEQTMQENEPDPYANVSSDIRELIRMYESRVGTPQEVQQKMEEQKEKERLANSEQEKKKREKIRQMMNQQFYK